MAHKILLVVHQETSDSGRVGRILREMGCALDYRIPSIGQPLPATVDGYAGAVIFGGPMSANDDRVLPFIRAELDWIPTALKSGKPFFGVCLGGQLLARVLGAKVAPRADGVHEIGYCPVLPCRAGCDIFEGPLTMYQWHNEGFELPAGAVQLAQGEAFPVQAYRYDGNAYAVQFHPEATPEIVERWSRLAAHKLSAPGAQPRERQLADTACYGPVAERWLRKFLARWLTSDADADAAVATGPATVAL